MRLNKKCRKVWSKDLAAKVIKTPPTRAQGDVECTEEGSIAELDAEDTAPHATHIDAMDVDPPEAHVPEPIPLRRPTVEDVEDEGDAHQPRPQKTYEEWIEDFPAVYEAGKAYETGEIPYEKIRADQQGGTRWGGFKSQEDWELAQWMVSTLGQNEMEELMKLGTVSRLRSMSFSGLHHAASPSTCL